MNTTVSQLISILKQYPPNAPIVTEGMYIDIAEHTYNLGDIKESLEVKPEDNKPAVDFPNEVPITRKDILSEKDNSHLAVMRASEKTLLILDKTDEDESYQVKRKDGSSYWWFRNIEEAYELITDIENED